MRVIDLNSPLPRDATEEELIKYGESLAIDSLLRDSSEDIKQIAYGSKTKIAKPLIISVAAIAIIALVVFGGMHLVDQMSKPGVTRIKSVEGQATLSFSGGPSQIVSTESALVPDTTLSLLSDGKIGIVTPSGATLSLANKAIFEETLFGEYHLHQGSMTVDATGARKDSMITIRLGEERIKTHSGLFTIVASDNGFDIRMARGSGTIVASDHDAELPLEGGHMARLNNGVQFITENSTRRPSIKNISLVYTITGDPIPGRVHLRQKNDLKLKELPATGYDMAVFTQGAVSKVSILNVSAGTQFDDGIPPYSFAGDDPEGSLYGRMNLRSGNHKFRVQLFDLDGQMTSNRVIYLNIIR